MLDAGLHASRLNISPLNAWPAFSAISKARGAQSDSYPQSAPRRASQLLRVPGLTRPRDDGGRRARGCAVEHPSDVSIGDNAIQSWVGLIANSDMSRRLDPGAVRYCSS